MSSSSVLRNSSLNPPRPRPPTRSIRSTPDSVQDTPPQSRQPTLAKRLLFPQLPLDATLPPLLASPSVTNEINNELYDFIAVTLRAYVNPWWTKISRYDKEFLPQITHILTAVFRQLESRLTSTDLSPLLLRDLPTLLNQHCIDYRNAQSKLLTSYASGGAATLPQLFHQLQSHMAVSPEGVVNEEYVRQAVDNVLKTCLPDEDYAPETERYIVREIILKVVAGGVIPKVTQPWFIHKTILDLLGPETIADSQQESSDAAPRETEEGTRPPLRRQSSGHFSFQSLAIFVLSAVRSISGICLALLHAYKQTLDTIKKVNESEPQFPPVIKVDPGDSGEPSPLLQPLLPGTLIPPTPMTPGVFPPSPTPSKTSSRTSSTYSLPQVTPPPLPPPPPNYTQASVQLLSTLLTVPPPPATSPPIQFSHSTSLALRNILSMLVTLLSPFLSKLLPYLLYTHVLSPATLAMTVRNARRALFPEGWPAPPPVDPTPEEQVAMRKEVERRLVKKIPGPLMHLFGPNSAAVAYTVSTMLDPLSSQACNAHLLVFILDLALVTVFPEMGVMVEGSSPVVGGDAATGGRLLKRRERELTPPRPDSRPP